MRTVVLTSLSPCCAKRHLLHHRFWMPGPAQFLLPTSAAGVAETRPSLNAPRITSSVPVWRKLTSGSKRMLNIGRFATSTREPFPCGIATEFGRSIRPLRFERYFSSRKDANTGRQIWMYRSDPRSPAQLPDAPGGDSSQAAFGHQRWHSCRWSRCSRYDRARPPVVSHLTIAIKELPCTSAAQTSGGDVQLGCSSR